MDPEIRGALKKHFGHETFMPGQEEVVGHLLGGRSAAAVFPTGGGKSLCYQLPALMLKGLTLVVSPLIALMKDQIDALRGRGVAAARLDSTLSAEEYFAVMDGVRGGTLRLLYVAPERFNNERFRAAMEAVPIALFAVDEAHCISEWGHNFRPDYLKLALFARTCGAERILALTATATPKVLADICSELGIGTDCAVRTPFYRPNLFLRTQPVEAEARDLELRRLIAERETGPTIVYVTLQRTAEEVAKMLASAGLPAKAYHAGMKDEVRHSVQEWFMASDGGIVVATIAFGMGIDKSNIRAVYHYNLSKSLESYSQEIGRAGRDGKNSICHTLVSVGDLNVLENFVYGDTPTEESIGSLLDDIFSREANFAVSIYLLSSDHDIRNLVTKTLLTDLELRGYLEGGTPFYENYRINFLAPEEEIAAGFDEERGQFLLDLFAQGKRGKKWLSIDPGKAANAMGSTRDRIVKALDYLGEKKKVELGVRGVMNRYRRLRLPEDRAALAAELYRHALEREQREIGRLRQVLDLIQNEGCQAAALSAHFGETLESPCGHCSWCIGGEEKIVLPGRTHPAIEKTMWERAIAVREEHQEILSSPRVFTRWLCGVTSPALTRSKLSGNPLFGALSNVPFHVVLEKSAE